MIAIDFGTGNKLCLHGPNGPIDKRNLGISRHLPPAQEFPQVLAVVLKIDNAVVESPTIGSSGAYIEDVISVVDLAPNKFFTLSARAVKGYCMEMGIIRPDAEKHSNERDIHSAMIIYTIATDRDWRLREWTKPHEKINRSRTNARPMDKHEYTDEESVGIMVTLPPFARLPADLRTSPIGLKGGYRRSLMIPFALAMDDSYYTDGPKNGSRKRFQKVIGAYHHGYPSFYRRMYVTWAHENAKIIYKGVINKEENVMRDLTRRHVAYSTTQRQWRNLLRLATFWREGTYPSDDELARMYPSPTAPASRRMRGV